MEQQEDQQQTAEEISMQGVPAGAHHDKTSTFQTGAGFPQNPQFGCGDNGKKQ